MVIHVDWSPRSTWPLFAETVSIEHEVNKNQATKMLYLLRMCLSVLFGVISVFLLMSAVEFHAEVNEAYRHQRQFNESIPSVFDNDTPAQQSADEYYDAMLGEIGFRYGIAGVFLVCSAMSLAFADRRKSSITGEERVYGPEEK